jgi:polyhydroxyalkanoate synthase
MDRADDAPVVLLVPAPIKGASIWDLAPPVSVTRRCVDSGLGVYLIDWGVPGERQSGFGLAEYGDRLILDCVETISRETGRSSVFLAGHSLGGTLAAIFATMHPSRVKGLILVGAPLCFGSHVGVIDDLVGRSPPASPPTDARSNVPGAFLSTMAFAADPVTFGCTPWLDWIGSTSSARAMDIHLRVVRWMVGEVPMARRLFEEIVEHLYRQNRFVRGTLLVGGKRAAPWLVEAPTLAVVDRRCPVVPPRAVLPFLQVMRCADRVVLWYRGDRGVALQHVGMLVGEQAHRHVWPAIIRWILTHEPEHGHS